MTIFVHCLFAFYKIYFEVAGVEKKVNSKVNSKEESHEKKVPPPSKKRTNLCIVCIEDFRIEDLVSFHKTHKLHVACGESLSFFR